mgnify:CR=1 FL=1
MEIFCNKIYPHIIGKKPQFEELKTLFEMRHRWQQKAKKLGGIKEVIGVKINKRG